MYKLVNNLFEIIKDKIKKTFLKRYVLLIKYFFIYAFAKYGIINSNRQINIIKTRKNIRNLRKDIIYEEYNKKQIIPVIVSLTSFPQRIKEVKYTLYSLLNQTIRPKLIILWLANDQFPNKEEINTYFYVFYKYNVQIKYTKNIGSYKKIIPALNLYKTDIIVTADDDIYYDRLWLEKLYKAYLKHKEEKVVVCHRMHKIVVKNNNILPYNHWKFIAQNVKPSPLNFATSGGGILFPPNCFYKDVTNEKLFTYLSKHADDIWLWAMIIMNGWNYISVSNEKFCVKSINFLRDANVIKNMFSLSDININQRKNDEQFEKIVNYYSLKQIIISNF